VLDRRDFELGPLGLIAYGHWGRPVLAFPSELGRRWDWEDRGIVDALAGLIDGGRVKLYCVDAADEYTWRADDVPLEERARRHGEYEAWVNGIVAPWIHADTDAGEIVVAGASFGAYHAANFALKRADLYPLAICMSGVYDVSVVGWGDRGDATYFNNPADYVSHLHGDHLDWLRSRVSLVLVCGQGQWEDTTGALESTKRFSARLGEKGIRHELDLWGHDVPHDWPSWQRQIAHHLPRFV
jgi:esterase/lipase superfamily enzyme